MADSFPPEVTVTEGAGGTCYRFPSRRLGAYRFIGLALVVPGLVLCCLPLVAVCLVTLAVLQHIPFAFGLIGCVVVLFSRRLIRFGLRTAAVGLFVLAGQSEIEVGPDVLAVRECWGPLRWVWRRSTQDLRRFLVSERLGPLNSLQGARAATAVVLNLLFGSCRGVGVITPLWKPAVAALAP
jgi:hypothetical protein